MVTGTINQRQAIKESYDNYTATLKRGLSLYGTDCGLHTLNMVTGSSYGKTSIITPMSDAAVRVLDDRRSELLVASWEMSPAKLIDRYVCFKTGLNLGQLKYAKILSDRHREMIHDAYGAAAKLPIHYHQYSTDIEVVKTMLMEFAEKVAKKSVVEGLKIQPVFVLDYIGRAKGTSKYSNRTYDIQGFLYGIKEICNATGISAFILAQINRGADQRDYPEVYDLSDSASIEQASDNVILLDRPEVRGMETIKDPRTGSESPAKNKALLRIVKARETAPGDVIVNCDMSTFRWSDAYHNFDFPYWEAYKDPNFWRNHLGI
jgi:replicative DNA helicase